MGDPLDIVNNEDKEVKEVDRKKSKPIKPTKTPTSHAEGNKIM